MGNRLRKYIKELENDIDRIKNKKYVYTDEEEKENKSSVALMEDIKEDLERILGGNINE